MTYLALARKWRPRSFSQLVGQDAISKAMINSLDQGRLHHAYLFAGTRGVGKTSIARLIAKALNCEKGVSSTPCLSCATCLSIEQGSAIDLIEIDAASRTRVEDTRAILDNVHYLPSSSRYKIYLIDEVHMLSMHSFNALLKTLEEPPAHVKFLLATTDPQKLPVTVLSRCLQFNLKALDIDTISRQLETIVNDESIAFEKAGLGLIAKAARGSMRDALSLLDQAIASMDSGLHLSGIKSMLGYTQRNFALELIHTLVQANAAQALSLCREIAREGGQFTYVLTSMLEILHELAVLQMTGSSHPELVNADPELAQMATQMEAEDLQLFYQIALKGLDDLPLAPTLAIGFEMTLLRMIAFKPAALAEPPPMAWQTLPPKVNPLPVETSIVPVEPPPIQSIQTTVKAPFDASNWALVIKALNLSGLALNALENTEFIEKIEHILHLKVTKGHKALFTKNVLERIEQRLADYAGESLQIQLTVGEQVNNTAARQQQVKNAALQIEARTALEKDPVFNQISQKFSAELVKNSIEILKNPL